MDKRSIIRGFFWVKEKVFRSSGIRVNVYGRNDKKKKVDILRLRPGMKIRDYYTEQFYTVTGFTYDDGIDWVVPCGETAYSPLLIE